MDDVLQEPATNAIEHNPSSTSSNAAKRSSDNPDSTNDNPNKRSKKSAHPQCITQILNEWITANSFNPYPSQQEKELMSSTGLNKKQLSDCLSKARKKMGLISKSQENVEESGGTEADSTCGVARVSLSPEAKEIGASESDEIRDEDVVDEKERNVGTVSISFILQEEKHKMPEVEEQNSQCVQKIASEASKIVEAANATTKAVDSTKEISCGSTNQTITISYKAGIVKAIFELKDCTGSSSIAIKKHMQANLPDDKKWMNAAFKKALKYGVEAGDFVKVNAPYNLSASFKEKEAVVPTGISYQGKIIGNTVYPKKAAAESAPTSQPKSVALTDISIREKVVTGTTVHPRKATTESAPTSQPKVVTETTVHPKNVTTESVSASQPTTQRQNTTVGLSESAKEYISKWIQDNSQFPTKYQKRHHVTS